MWPFHIRMCKNIICELEILIPRLKHQKWRNIPECVDILLGIIYLKLPLFSSQLFRTVSHIIIPEIHIPGPYLLFPIQLIFIFSLVQ